MKAHPQQITQVVLGDKEPSIEEFVAVARYAAKVSFSEAYQQRVKKSRGLVERFLDENRLVYGVTTGFGDNVRHVISASNAKELQVNIVRSHAVAVGEPLKREQVRAIQLMVLISLGKGYSGVRLELLELIAALLNNDVVPFAPGEGSVGYLAELPTNFSCSWVAFSAMSRSILSSKALISFLVCLSSVLYYISLGQLSLRYLILRT